MGIEGLLKVTNENGTPIKDMWEPVEFDEDDIIGIDAFLLIYASLTGGYQLKTKDGKLTMHIVSITKRIMSMNKKQVWVFDNSIKLEEKKETVANRAKRRVVLPIEIGQAVADIQDLLTRMNVTWVVSPPQVEAEAYLVELKRLYLINYIYSRDTDVLACGQDMMVFEDNGFRLYKINSILREFRMNMDTFREMCCHLGSDFNKKTAGLTPKTVIEKMELSSLTAAQKNSFIIFSLRCSIDYQDNVKKLKDIQEYNASNLIEFLTELECFKLVETIKNIDNSFELD